MLKEDGNASASWNTTDSVIAVTYKGYETTININDGSMSQLAKIGSTIKIVVEEEEGDPGKVNLKVTATIGNKVNLTVEDWLKSLSEDELKDMYAAMYTNGQAVWSQCMGNYENVRDAWEKQYGGTNGPYKDEYEMMINTNKVNMNQYLVEQQGIKTLNWIKSLTEDELKDMYAYCYTRGAATWEQCMISYSDVKDYYDKTQKSNGLYSDEYDMMVKKGYIDENTIKNTLAKITITVNGESKKAIDSAEFIITTNGEYNVRAVSDNGVSGETVFVVSKCYPVGYDHPYIPIGFSHTGNEDWNHGYTIIGNVGTDNEGDQFVWVPCSTETTPPDGVVRFSRITDSNTPYNSNNYTLGSFSIASTSIYTEDSSVKKIRESVGYFGGFYIAKYEAGLDITWRDENWSVDDRIITKVDGSVKPKSQENMCVWNYIDRPDCITVARAMVDNEITGVHSALISGECWDTTLSWIAMTADADYPTIGSQIEKDKYSSSDKVHRTGIFRN